MEKINQNSEFLQSEHWCKFQKAVGRKTHIIKEEDFSASVIEHMLPIVGKYFYIPRGPVFSCHSEWSVAESKNLSPDPSTTVGMTRLIELAEKENVGWIRIEPENNQVSELIRDNIQKKIIKAPHDMQPKEIFVIDVSKSAEQLLTEMKPKTRYNIGIAKKKGVVISNSSLVTTEEKNKYIEAFLKLTKEMANRHGISAHPEQYYRKMIESLPSEMLKIYVAEFDGKIIAANLVLFFGNTATYLHGASGNLHRNLMAPFLLQWQAILDAKGSGFVKYDFGGINTTSKENSLTGVTTFKLGFSPKKKPVEFPGTYDIIVNPRTYAVYRGLQRAKAFLHFMQK